MRLLDRYLLREFLAPLGYCLAGFLIFWIAFNLFDDLRGLQEQQLSAGQIAAYYLLRIPEFLPIAMPVALLLALLYSLTNHARHHELTAIRAAGVSLWRLCLPYLGVGLFAGLVLFASNEFWAPDAVERAERILTQRSRQALPSEERHRVKNLMFKSTREGRTRIWRVAFYNRRTTEMIQPLVDWQLPDNSWRSLVAERAVYAGGRWIFYDVREFKEIRQDTTTNSLLLQLPQTNMMSFAEITESPEEIASEIKVTDRFSNAQSRTYRADIPIAEVARYLRLHPNPEGMIGPWLYTKLHGRFAGPFTCVVVVLIAVPFSAAPGRRNVFVGVAASIVIYFVYYVVQQLGFAFGEAGRVPPWLGAWLPNLLFGAAGLWMMIKVR